jgi:hypothetical protein|nr:MAG TPA: hypothetical protein [Caudoviricetes sp.]
MKNIVKTVKTLELIWPGYSLASSMCRILDRLEEDLVPYWELYWDGERDEIGIRFASQKGEIKARPGCVVLIEDGHAVRMRKNLKDENDPTTRINEKKRAVAYIYDSEDLKDLRALSEAGRRVVLDEDRILVSVSDSMIDVTGSWIAVESGDENLTWFDKGSNPNVTIEDIARHYKGKLA